MQRQITAEEMEEIVEKVGHPRGRHRKIPIDVEQVRAMLAAAFSKRQVADYFGVSKMTIIRRLKGI